MGDPLDSRFRGNDDLGATISFEIATKCVYEEPRGIISPSGQVERPIREDSPRQSPMDGRYRGIHQRA